MVYDHQMEVSVWAEGEIRHPPMGSGSRNLLQAVLSLDGSQTTTYVGESAERILYICRGSGLVGYGSGDLDIRVGSAVLLGPGHYVISPTGTEQLIFVSVSSLDAAVWEKRFPLSPHGSPVSIHEDDQEALPAGEDRYFKLLIDPRYGAKHFTQFIGFIDRSRAPFHTHTYEEAIYILEGEGVVHIKGLPEQPIRPGTSIFLPPGTPHCLENRSDGVLKLLGVFSPPGSPAARTEGR